MTTSVGMALAGGLGLILGSFLNVVAYRLPRKENLAVPASRCPGCETPIRAYDNIPVVSWLALRGRCRSCGTSIAWRYPLVELLTGVLMALVVLRFGVTEEALLGLVFVVLLVPIAVIDLDFRIIPNSLTLVGAVAAPVILAFTDPGALPEAAIAAVAASGALLAAAIARPGGMGMGDVKLAFVMGLFLGREVAFAMLVAFAAGALVGAVVMARKGAREGGKTAIPFGPFLAFGSVVGLLAGEPVMDWYLSTF